MSRNNFRKAWRSVTGQNAEPTIGMNILALTAGVLVGVVAGVYLADRLGGVSGIKSRFRHATGHSAEEDQDEHMADRQYSHHEMDDEDYDEEEAEEGMFTASYDHNTEELEVRVLDAFSNDPVLSERAVDIGAVGPATIELTGWVHTNEEVTHAATIARGVPGVTHVVNDLSVRADEQSPPSAL